LKGITFHLRNTYTSNVYLLRNSILKDNAASGGIKVSDNVPLNGFPYDYLMWIDSDMVFTPEQFFKMLAREKDIMSGSAMTDPRTRKLNWGKIDTEGRCNFVTKDTVKDFPLDEDGLADVDFVGYAWLLVRKGVYEKMLFPWFRPMTTRYGNNMYFPSEDIGWCHAVKELGFKIYVDPELHIGHEKPVVMVG